MKALSGYACWFYAMFWHDKDIENRDWPTKHRGTIILHTSARTPKEDIENWQSIALQLKGREAEKALKYNEQDMYEMRVQEMLDMPTEHLIWKPSHLIGSVDIIDCVHINKLPAKYRNSPWAFGEYCWIVENAILFDDPIPAKGKLGLWDLSPEQEQSCQEKIDAMNKICEETKERCLKLIRHWRAKAKPSEQAKLF